MICDGCNRSTCTVGVAAVLDEGAPNDSRRHFAAAICAAATFAEASAFATAGGQPSG
jgi:hypothetical protein